MLSQPLTLGFFSKAIVHIDGDAFFASCEQSLNPTLKGKPVVTGKERGIASSMSYEAKARGVTRGMRLFEIKKICPDAVILPSDYETYSLLSQRLYSIVRRYTPDVEEYGIDECFADLTGLRRIYRMSYESMAEKIKQELDSELGFTFSIGLAPNKVIAKVASKWKKPSGLTIIPGRLIHQYLQNLPVEKIWGIGGQTAAFLNKHGIRLALDFARQNELWVKALLSKPFYEIWQELNGKFIFPIDTSKKIVYRSIQKMKTFTPASSDRDFVFAQLSQNLENACMKARRYKLAAREVLIFLRTQGFDDVGLKIRLSRPNAHPHEIMKAITPLFNHIFKSETFYRATCVTLLQLDEIKVVQLTLFDSPLTVEKWNEIYQNVDELRDKYGKHSVFLGSSLLAHQARQHEGERGMLPERREVTLKGETKRKRLGIPMFMGDIAW
ncbi:MAG: DNA polymerase IV [Candidatus Riflebacteria bacterium]|nr:DNA polymerase IV [Candidatus Riflebacteria bacterium]